jgi:hypothetical protein
MERKNLPQKWEKLSQISKKLKNKNKNYLKINFDVKLFSRLSNWNIIFSIR